MPPCYQIWEIGKAPALFLDLSEERPQDRGWLMYIPPPLVPERARQFGPRFVVLDGEMIGCQWLDLEAYPSVKAIREPAGGMVVIGARG